MAMTDKKQPDPIDVHVGSRLKSRRIQMSISQVEFARRLNLTFQQVHKYETGTNRIGAGRLQAIAILLDVPVSHFFEDAARDADLIVKIVSPSQTHYAQTFLTSPEGVALNEAFVKIKNSRVRKSVIALVRTIVANDDAAVSGTPTESR